MGEDLAYANALYKFAFVHDHCNFDTIVAVEIARRVHAFLVFLSLMSPCLVSCVYTYMIAVLCATMRNLKMSRASLVEMRHHLRLEQLFARQFAFHQAEFVLGLTSGRHVARCLQIRDQCTLHPDAMLDTFNTVTRC